MDLSSVPTKELIDELKTREGIELGVSGPYANYDLIRRYARRDRHISAEAILIIEKLDTI